MKVVIVSVYLSICLFVRLYPIEIGLTPSQPTLPYQQHHPYTYPILPLSLLKLDQNDPGPKRLTYLGRNDPPQKLAETTRIQEKAACYIIDDFPFRQCLGVRYRTSRLSLGIRYQT